MSDLRNRSVALRVSYRSEPMHRAPSRARLRPHSAVVAAGRRRMHPVRKALARARPALLAVPRRMLSSIHI
jgi:hypothetical protein